MSSHGKIKFRAGLVGAGYISEYHVAALKRLPNVELVGVFDVDAAKAKALAERFGTKAMPSLAELREAGADVIHVLTPPHTHAAVALEALDLGCHVLVEKPLAVEAEDCDRIERKAAATGLSACVNHSLLFDPQVRRALDTVHSGKLGKVASVDILRSSAYPPYEGGPLPPQYRTGGYPFRDLGVHALYLFEALLGPIEHVDARWASLGGEPNLAFDEWRALVQCKQGMGQFQLSWNVKPLQSQIIIQGTKGVLRVDLFLMFQARRGVTPLPKAAERVINALTDSLKPLVDVPRGVLGFVRGKVLPYHGLQDLVAEFYRSLENGSPAPVSAADAARVVRWTEDVARAADEEYRRRVAAFQLSERVPVLVTGASGALGGAIVERLREQGKRVRVFVRRPPDQVPEGVEVALGDLGDPVAVDRAVKGADLVIHAGAAMKGGWPEHQRATVTGTQNVLEACAKYGVAKLVHVSSMSVVDWAGGRRGSEVTESTAYEPRAGERGYYTRAKLEAEQLVSRCTREYGIRSVILRPGQIFGGRIPLLTGAVARKLGKRWLVLGNGKLPLPLVHVDDVVDGIVAAAESALGGGEIIQLVDESELLTQNDVLHLTVGPSAGIVRLPRPIVFLLGGISELLLRLLKRQSPLSRYRLRSALSVRRFRSERSHLLPWKPRVGVRPLIERMYPRDGEPAAGERAIAAAPGRAKPAGLAC